MKVSCARRILALVFGVLLCGCGSYWKSVPLGGVVGGGVGAGTGALIASAISNGDVAASAALGAGIGIPVGMALAAVLEYESPQSRQERFEAEVRETQEQIFAREQEIAAIREQIRMDSPRGVPPAATKDYLYLGPSLGNPYRY